MITLLPKRPSKPRPVVVDCTIRDGGLMNHSQFSLECVQAVYRAVCAAGVQVIELGYRNSRRQFDPAAYGPWRFCDDEMILRVLGDAKAPGTRIAVMMDAHKSDPRDLKPRAASPVDLVRCATYVEDLDKALVILNDARAKGYDTAVNIMSLSTVAPARLDEALHRLREEAEVQACYVVDSFGNLFPQDVARLVGRFQALVPGAAVGIHAHNNQQLAFANTLEAHTRGAEYLDATLYGLGRGAGNCNLELLIHALKDPAQDLRPLLDVITAHILPLRDGITWGYTLPYLVTGIQNRHPDEAMAFLASEKAQPGGVAIRDFFEQAKALARA